MDAISHFENYLKVGFRVIPLRPNTKKPIAKKWSTEWSENGARTLFQFHSKANLGILLGSIVDVEGDSVEANELIEELIGDYPHPSYLGSKSTHHLFQNPDKNLTRISRNGIEFRAHRHQSVLPPSIHPDGSQYKWLTDFIPIPPMPPALLEFYGEFQSTAPKTSSPRKLRRDLIILKCPCCQKRIKMNRRRYRLECEAFREKTEAWCCSKCRKFDIRPLCRMIKKQRRLNK